jgi:hypothetical protein
VLVHVADANWRSGLGDAKDPYGRTYRGIVDYNKYFDTVIEAIDVARAQLLGTVRIDNAAFGFTDDGLMFGYDEASSGEPFIPVWRVTRPGGS